jgi:hypothetical protein
MTKHKQVSDGEEFALECWQRSLSNLAGDAISMRAFWTKEFGQWERFDRPSDLVTLARQAAEAWTELADDLAAPVASEALVRAGREVAKMARKRRARGHGAGK